MDAVKDEGPWIIKKRGLYYRANAQGYTSNIAEAGRYSYDEAHDHMNACGPGEVVIFPVDSPAYVNEMPLKFCVRCGYEGTDIDGLTCKTCVEAIRTGSEPNGADRSPKPIKSDGGSSGYYVLPANATELRHLIQARKMNFSIGNIFKACWRLGLKAGTEKYYDLRKMVFFVLDEYEADGPAVYKTELNKLRDHIDKELARLG